MLLRRLPSAAAYSDHSLLLQTHGFPKVMGVLTHLDAFKDQKRLKKTKKTLKHRFWAEIYQGGVQPAGLLKAVEACAVIGWQAISTEVYKGGSCNHISS